ncbi:MAG: NADPH:quinone oxidoreductase family protein [Alphaproteobacteria bacterium]
MIRQSVRSLICRELSEDLSGLALGMADLPPPGPEEVRVRMKAAGLNFPDLLMTQGRYQHRPELPFVPGMEGAGEVVAAGAGVTGFGPGDAVIASARTGLMAEEANVPAAQVRPKPASLSWEQAAGFVTAYLTAHVALVRRAALEPGETLLVHGAGGGVGLAAVETGKILGATVIACAGTEAKRRAAQEAGADHVLDSSGGFREQVKQLTAGCGADVIYDPVGGDVFDESLRCIAWGGRLLVVGFASGRIPSVPANLPLIKGFSVVGVRAGEYGRRDPEKGAENVEAVLRRAEEGRLHPHVGLAVPFGRAVDAFRAMKARRLVGKAVISFGA